HLNKLLPAKAKVAPVKHYEAMPYAEVPAFVKRLRTMSGTAARALEFTIMTASRTSEVLGAVWSEFDLEARMWTVPKERMKNRKEHRVPLCNSAIAIIKAMPDDGEYVFPGAKKGQPLSSVSMLKVLGRMGEQSVVHGFRSTFRDWGSEIGDYP